MYIKLLNTIDYILMEYIIVIFSGTDFTNNIYAKS